MSYKHIFLIVLPHSLVSFPTTLALDMDLGWNTKHFMELHKLRTALANVVAILLHQKESSPHQPTQGTTLMMQIAPTSSPNQTEYTSTYHSYLWT